MPLPAPFPVLVHPYPSPERGNTCAYEIGNTSSKNALVFIGGLSDGPHTVPYIWTVAQHLERASDLGYSVFEFGLKSSFIGFGTSSLANDVRDICAVVKYLRRIGREKIVLMGHSTGCQDCMEYARYDTYSNERVDAFILQAPVSDREGLEALVPDYKTSLAQAMQMIADGQSNQIVPGPRAAQMFGAPITAYRLHSLCAPGGDDDYFSSDLDDETVATVWGRFKQPVLVLHSAEDEFVPSHVNQVELNEKYRKQNPLVSPLSGVIPGAGHTVPQGESREWLAHRVLEFLATLDKAA